MSPPVVTYLATLDALDGEEATIASADPQDGTVNATLTMRREDWEHLARPGERIVITVTTESAP